MKRSLILLVLVGIAVSANVQAQCGPPLPTPRVAFVSKSVEPGFIRYKFTVTNHATFNNVFFTPSPNLPPCGLNVNASRTWLNIFNANGGAYIYGYCALTASSELTSLTFAVPKASPQPKGFFITLEDRLCHVTKKSNAAAIP
ncbi:MAG: hypothetical protein QOC81_2716 [Thermoanaerobaculia bacterium]|jgi:hypothetical protein|nr:hypothetical protein [Thermoanaerobaculia bacterium]